MTDKLCKFYISSKKCKFGKHCRFLHLNIPQPINISECDLNTTQNGSLNSEVSNTTICNQEIFSTDKNNLKPLKDEELNTPTQAPQQPVKRICRFFKTNKNCNYGNNCNFSHELDINKAQDVSRIPRDHQMKLKDEDSISDEGSNLQDGITNEPTVESKKGICPYFSKNGHCKFGKKCTQLHFCDKRNSNERKNQSKTEEKRNCPYFIKGYCRWGQRCRFLHTKDFWKNESNLIGTNNENEVEEKLTVHPKPFIHPVRAPYIPTKPTTPKRSEASEQDLRKMKENEINLIKKRISNEKLTIIDDDQTKFVGRFCFTPSDPDWPFDVKDFVLELKIPEFYPKEMLMISLPKEQDIPETVQRYVEESINQWLMDKNETLTSTDKLELVFKPLLKWLEKTMMDIVTNALRQYKKELIAKAAGFEFIPASRLQANVAQDDAASLEKDAIDEESDGNGDDNDDEDESSTSESENKENDSSAVDVEKKFTEILFKNLQLKEQSGTLVLKKIHICIQCARCRNKSEFSTPCNRFNSIECTKCHEVQLLRFRPAIAHQFSSILGYLDLENCVPFDLILQDCEPVVSCMNCHKTNMISTFCSGQPKDLNCRSCHEKLRVAVDAVKFQELQQSVVVSDMKHVHKVGVKKSTKAQKDPAIQEGKPLPAYGACKHYKKSFRWLRFPCCGKAYPCDICHNEKETDHEMKYANRMICGYCCREQVYSVEKPCKGCSLLMTKSSGSHWEGGQGCRDKIRMSKGDSQKYSNMGKTISKHSQKVKDMNSKKKTKLRHT